MRTGSDGPLVGISCEIRLKRDEADETEIRIPGIVACT